MRATLFTIAGLLIGTALAMMSIAGQSPDRVPGLPELLGEGIVFGGILGAVAGAVIDVMRALSRQKPRHTQEQ